MKLRTAPKAFECDMGTRPTRPRIGAQRRLLRRADPHPRCAYVDLLREELAPQTLSSLLPDDAGGGTEKVVRSRRLNIYFSGSDYLLARVKPDQQGVSRRRLNEQPLYELRTNVIRAVQSCVNPPTR